MMSYMGTVTVILLNILIAQMSTTYTQAKKVARLEYDPCELNSQFSGNS